MIWKNASANAQFRAQLGSLSESRHISAASMPQFKRTCNATMGLHGQSPDLENEAIGTKFRHLVFNTSQTPYERSMTNNRTPISLVKTGYRLLGHLQGLPWGQPQFQAPFDSPLGDYPTAEHDAMST
ncbi:hypothetical protein M9H77_20961 [Catharanthus roseus]|uniref:Uncharacterized protein n=1 Tax=Catharanthus roseus TaxID=4058 RepID=A0ACC0ANY2_CATRO|nr:hypothetical protein M9H77_20961 [Catharanthus roseus]